MRKDIIFGVDQSFSSTGLSIKNRITGDSIELSIMRSGKHLDWFDRAESIAKGIVSIAEGYSEPILVLEGLPFGNLPGNSGKNLAGLQFVIITKWRAVQGEGRDFIVAPTALKKFATGSGKAAKDDMVYALPTDIQSEVRAQPKSKGRHDLADAWWLSEYYIREIYSE